MIGRAMERKFHEEEPFPVEVSRPKKEEAAPQKMEKENDAPLEYKGLVNNFGLEDVPGQEPSPPPARRDKMAGQPVADPASKLELPRCRLGSRGFAPVDLVPADLLQGSVLDVTRPPQPTSGGEQPTNEVATTPAEGLGAVLDGSKGNDPEAVIALLGELLRAERQRSLRAEERAEALAMKLEKAQEETHEIEKQLVRAQTLLEAASKK